MMTSLPLRNPGEPTELQNAAHPMTTFKLVPVLAHLGLVLLIKKKQTLVQLNTERTLTEKIVISRLIKALGRMLAMTMILAYVSRFNDLI